MSKQTYSLPASSHVPPASASTTHVSLTRRRTVALSPLQALHSYLQLSSCRSPHLHTAVLALPIPNLISTHQRSPPAPPSSFFFFNDPAPPDIHPLPLHAPLPI